MVRTASAVVIATLAAVALALAGYFVARATGLDIDFWPTLATAVIVGGFLALLLFAPRGKDEEADGFEVVGKRRQGDDVEMKRR